MRYPTYTQNPKAWLKRAGFLEAEAVELAHTSRAGIKSAPYYQRMIARRRGVLMNAVRWGWTEQQWKDWVISEYLKKGLVTDAEALNFEPRFTWRLVRWYEESVPVPDEYESPWRKRVEKRRTRKGAKAITPMKARQQMLSQKIREIDMKIMKEMGKKGTRAYNTYRIKDLERERQKLLRKQGSYERG